MGKEETKHLFQNEDSHWWFIGRRLIIRTILDRFLISRQNQRVLEIGAGTGGNLEMLSKYGDLYAMEPDNEARMIANKRGWCEVKKGMLPSDIPFDHNFDLVCLLDVLEHIDDRKDSLSSIYLKMESGGTLLITVPAYQWLWSYHDLQAHHRIRYRKNELVSLLEKCKFKVTYSSYFNSIFLPLLVVIRFFKGIFLKVPGTDSNLPSALINNICIKIFAIESMYLRFISFSFGMSIILLAKK